MGKIIRAVRYLKEHHLRIKKRKEILKVPVLDDCTATVKSIKHERGRCAPNAEIHAAGKKFLISAIEGMYEGMEIQMKQKAELKIGNYMEIGNIQEGLFVSMVEREVNDGGHYAMITGCCVKIVGHNRLTKKTTVKLPSGKKVELNSRCRAFIGMIAGGGIKDKPLLKAGISYYKNKAAGRKWPRVRGVAMNPVEHPHGGGNHQHVGHSTTISKNTSLNARVGLIGARRTGKK